MLDSSIRAVVARSSLRGHPVKVVAGNSIGYSCRDFAPTGMVEAVKVTAYGVDGGPKVCRGCIWDDEDEVELGSRGNSCWKLENVGRKEVRR